LFSCIYTWLDLDQCTPDFKPAFDNLAESGAKIGEVLTHWFDVLYIIIFDRTTIEDVCSIQEDFKNMWQDPVAARMFGYNSTTLIRMTPSAFAITDGQSVMYVTQNPLRRAYAPTVWPFSVNTAFGVARVGLPAGIDVQDGGVGLFGCSCSDTLTSSPTTATTTAQTAVQLQCAVITRNTQQAWILPVAWSLSTEVQLLTCNRLRIVVQSLRWPQPRVSVVSMAASSLYAPSCASSSSCVLADVVIYAIPVCGAQDGFKSMVNYYY